MTIPEGRGRSLFSVLGRRAENYQNTVWMPGTMTEVWTGIYVQIINVGQPSREATWTPEL